MTSASPTLVLEREDSQPEFSGVEYPCSVCGAESGPYTGRGRKPTRCPNHKRGPAQGTTRAVGVKNDGLARQATEALVSINSIAGTAIFFLGFPETGSAIADRQDTFREQAYAALLTDPELCKMILRAGVASGRLQLAVAYVLMVGSVAPAAMIEYRAKREERNYSDEE